VLGVFLELLHRIKHRGKERKFRNVVSKDIFGSLQRACIAYNVRGRAALFYAPLKNNGNNNGNDNGNDNGSGSSILCGESLAGIFLETTILE